LKIRSDFKDVITAVYDSPIGRIKISASNGRIFEIDFTDSDVITDPSLEYFTSQLDEYFYGNRKIFSAEYDLHVSDFQKKVYEIVSRIPFGEIITYSDVANMLGNKYLSRSVGNALASNPLILVIPCHRIVRTDGIGGYTGGIWRKRWLLSHEMAI